MTNQDKTHIPKTIHQVWEGRNGDAPCDLLLRLAETWKEENPSWKYRFWNYKTIDKFLLEYFPGFIEKYFSFRYDVQRWDAIRYLILYKFGGVYADLDYECLEPLDWLFENKNCCLGLEPQEHCQLFNKSRIIGNAFMAVVPKHPFFKCIIEEISNNHSDAQNKFSFVMETTGPDMITMLYKSYPEKEQIWLIPSELTSPVSKNEVALIVQGKATDSIAEKIEKAYAVHYYFGSWCDDGIINP
jgi:inositol phosphorylceramide mannosyltransferase catalytic subunit